MPYVVNRINPETTAMIVVDMQNDFIADDGAFRSAQAAANVDALARTLDVCREHGIRIVYTQQIHRANKSDTGIWEEMFPPIADGAHVEGSRGVEIHPKLAPMNGEPVVQKHRWSGFFATDLDLILRKWGIERVVISGATTENCCQMTARDAVCHGYGVIFLADATGTIDYPDLGFGAMSAEEVHRSTLRILSWSTAHVMTTAAFLDLIASSRASQSVDSAGGIVE